MRIFTNGENWGQKLNIVDENNVFVGFDYSNSCCESFGYIVSDTFEGIHNADHNFETSDYEAHNKELADYVFDPSFHEVVPSADEWDEGALGVFKAVCEGKPDKFICLFNYHNGYYGHGFEMNQGETILFQGTL